MPVEHDDNNIDPEKEAKKAATVTHTYFTELVKKGMNHKDALELSKNIARAGDSTSHGCCAPAKEM